VPVTPPTEVGAKATESEHVAPAGTASFRQVVTARAKPLLSAMTEEVRVEMSSVTFPSFVR